MARWLNDSRGWETPGGAVCINAKARFYLQKSVGVSGGRVGHLGFHLDLACLAQALPHLHLRLEGRLWPGAHHRGHQRLRLWGLVHRLRHRAQASCREPGCNKRDKRSSSNRARPKQPLINIDCFRTVVRVPPSFQSGSRMTSEPQSFGQVQHQVQVVCSCSFGIPGALLALSRAGGRCARGPWACGGPQGGAHSRAPPAAAPPPPDCAAARAPGRPPPGLSRAGPPAPPACQASMQSPDLARLETWAGPACSQASLHTAGSAGLAATVTTDITSACRQEPMPGVPEPSFVLRQKPLAGPAEGL